jgi:hypothetical protein
MIHVTRIPAPVVPMETVLVARVITNFWVSLVIDWDSAFMLQCCYMVLTVLIVSHYITELPFRLHRNQRFIDNSIAQSRSKPYVARHS